MECSLDSMEPRKIWKNCWNCLLDVIPSLSLLSLSSIGVPINDDLYAWVAVFLLPVNSALNPILYTLTTKLFKQHFARIIAYGLRSSSPGADNNSGTSFSSIIIPIRGSCKRVKLFTRTDLSPVQKLQCRMNKVKLINSKLNSQVAVKFAK